MSDKDYFYDGGAGLKFDNWQAAESARRRMIRGGRV